MAALPAGILIFACDGSKISSCRLSSRITEKVSGRFPWLFTNTCPSCPAGSFSGCNLLENWEKPAIVRIKGNSTIWSGAFWLETRSVIGWRPIFPSEERGGWNTISTSDCSLADTIFDRGDDGIHSRGIPWNVIIKVSFLGALFISRRELDTLNPGVTEKWEFSRNTPIQPAPEEKCT